MDNVLANRCENYKCKHGGKCLTDGNKPYCKCQPGYKGEDCGKGKVSSKIHGTFSTSKNFLNSVPSCENQKNMDLTIVLDGSTSINFTEFYETRLFLKDVVSHLEIDGDKSRVGLVQFADTVRNEFWMNQHKTKAEIIAKIRTLRRIKGLTFIADV